MLWRDVRDGYPLEHLVMEDELKIAKQLIEVLESRLERFEGLEKDARTLAEWAAETSPHGSEVYAAARRYLSGVANV